MKKIFLILILVAIPLFIMGQREPVRQSEPFTVETEKPFIFVSQEFKGSVEQLNQFMNEFTKNFFDQKLIPLGQPMALFYNEPKNSRDRNVKMEIGFPVSGREKVKSPLKSQEMNLPSVAKYVHTGPYEKLFGTHERMKGLASNRGYNWTKKYTILRFVNNPSFVRPEEIKTEVLIPLEGSPPLLAAPLLRTEDSINYQIVYKEYKGPVSKLGEFVDNFMKDFFAQKLSPGGPPMVVFTNTPRDQKEEVKMKVGFPIGDRQMSATFKPPLKVDQVKMGKVVRRMHTGPYENIFGTQQDTLRLMRTRNMKQTNSQAILILLNNPSYVKKEDIQAEVILPVGQ
ncbi:MAG: GyrI-like domain-containing protein [Candidatus Omnitrophota bacterium]